MTMTRDQMIEDFEKRLANHKLEVICDTDHVKCFRLAEGKSVIMSTYITFTPDGISIAGDLTPSENADYCRGYGLDWFTENLDGSYLAEKFRLQKKWQEDKAIEQWKQFAEQEEDPDVKSEMEKVSGRYAETPDYYYNYLCDMGWGDDPTMEWLVDHEVAWLLAIHRAFRRKYLGLT